MDHNAGDGDYLESLSSGSVGSSVGLQTPEEPGEVAQPAQPEPAAAAEPEPAAFEYESIAAAAEPESVQELSDGGAAVEAEPEEPEKAAEPEGPAEPEEPIAPEEPAEPVGAPGEEAEQPTWPGTAAGSSAGPEGPEEPQAEARTAPSAPLSPSPTPTPTREHIRSRERESVTWKDDGEDRRVCSDEEQSETEDAAWSEEEQRQQEHQLRTELLDQYHALLVERNRYQGYNTYLQHKIQESLRKKKGLEVAEAPEKAEPQAPEKEQAYLHCLAMLEELKKQQADDLSWYQQELAQLKQQCQEKVARAEKEWHAFQALEKQVVLQVMGSGRLHGGRQAALQKVEQIQALEDKKEKDMSAVRLENVQLKQSLVHFQTRMKAQEDMTQGLFLIDFEQLKIENQTFNEKVEERNEELLKLRNKVSNNVQIITHVKEKLHFVEMENAHKKARLLELEAHVARKRDILTKTKQARDSLRLDNTKLNKTCGLLGKEALLQDLEDRVDRTKQLRQRLEDLKRHHAGLVLSCRGVKQKIREAKAFLPS
ncbi:cilia- and flagella-associated protein 184 [Rhynchocyon petersi]